MAGFVNSVLLSWARTAKYNYTVSSSEQVWGNREHIGSTIGGTRTSPGNHVNKGDSLYGLELQSHTPCIQHGS